MRLRHRAIVALTILFACVDSAFAQVAPASADQQRADQQAASKKFPRADWGAVDVDVSQDASSGKWTIKGNRNTLTLDKNLALEIKAGGTTWKMVPSTASDMLVKVGEQEFPVRLADAGKMEIVPYDAAFQRGVKITLDDWKNPAGGRVSLPLYLTIALEGPEEELCFNLAADESQALVRRLDWPTAIDKDSFDRSVLPAGRGALLPKNWPTWFHPIRSKESETTEVQSNVIECWSMSWWGFEQGKSAMMIIVETPDDAAYQFEHPAGGPTVIGPRWRECLGQLRYPRACRMCFFENGNYVMLAKRYRQYAKDTGLFVSLAEKIARQPRVKDLIGTPQTRLGILTNIKSDSLKYNKENPASNHRMTTFEDRAKQLREWKAQGMDKLIVVLTGWPREGYDRQHPDELPPAPEAGGYEGMAKVSEACKELGYVFALHDQYRDYYVDAPSYDTQFAVHEESESAPPHGFPGTRFGTWKAGKLEFMNNWDGGTMTYLNNRFMLGHLVKTYRTLFDHNVRPVGTYLDVFGYVPPDEDFNPEHPTTRSQAIRGRQLCYTWSRNNIGFIGTEAGCDWTVPFVDCASSMNVSTKYIGVPLFSLVYHDAVIIPYGVFETRLAQAGKKGAAAEESGPRKLNLYGFLNAGPPQMGRIDNLSKDDLDAAKKLSALHKRLAQQEMTNHEFLDDAFRKQRSTFADGTTVTIDLDAGSLKIEPELVVD
jgi:hypothetical protein